MSLCESRAWQAIGGPDDGYDTASLGDGRLRIVTAYVQPAMGSWVGPSKKRGSSALFLP